MKSLKMANIFAIVALVVAVIFILYQLDKISSNQEDVGGLKEDIQEIEEKISYFSSLFEGLETKILSFYENLSSLSSKIKKVEEEKGNLQDKMASLEKRVRYLEKKEGNGERFLNPLPSGTGHPEPKTMSDGESGDFYVSEIGGLPRIITVPVWAQDGSVKMFSYVSRGKQASMTDLQLAFERERYFRVQLESRGIVVISSQIRFGEEGEHGVLISSYEKSPKDTVIVIQKETIRTPGTRSPRNYYFSEPRVTNLTLAGWASNKSWGGINAQIEVPVGDFDFIGGFGVIRSPQLISGSLFSDIQNKNNRIINLIEYQPPYEKLGESYFLNLGARYYFRGGKK